MDEIQLLKKEVKNLKDILDFLVFSDRYIFQKHIQMFDAKDMTFGTNKGTRIGTTSSQKFAFHAATPVTQRAGASQVAVATTASTNTTPFGYTTSAQADAIVTLVNEIRATLVEKGLMKGSA